MTEPQAYLNGAFVPASHAVLSVADAGFVQGTTVAEQLRTFGGKLFRLQQHIERLFRSLDILGVSPGLEPNQFCQIAETLVGKNHPLLADGDDLGLAIFVTPGLYTAMGAPDGVGPTVCLHTFPLSFRLWADKYQHGEALATTDVVQVSADCWPPELKCRSRMHYYLADRQARARFPGSRALMLDQEGFVTEATTANVVLVVGQKLLLPPAEKILPGITLAATIELARQGGLTIEHRDLTPDEVALADEVLLVSTSICALPVLRFNGQIIGGGEPGPTFKRLLAGWSALVGLDVAAQAKRFSQR